MAFPPSGSFTAPVDDLFDAQGQQRWVVMAASRFHSVLELIERRLRCARTSRAGATAHRDQVLRRVTERLMVLAREAGAMRVVPVQRLFMRGYV